eukprot:6160094-Ditylum_brightwellii.AAC.1
MEANNDFSHKPVNSLTLKFYKSLICCDHNITQMRKQNITDDMRFASETSLLMVCTYIVGVAVTHLLPGTPSPNHHAHHSFGTAGSQLLAKHVSDTNDIIKVYPENPAFVIPTDNTTICINDSEDANNKDSISLALRDIDDSSRNKKSK